MRKYLHLYMPFHLTELLTLYQTKCLMAKEIIKKKSATIKKTVKAKSPVRIEKIAENVLDKLKTLHLDPSLQSDIVWCLGSYTHDQNPVGLIEKTEQALTIFKAELGKKTKGITVKFISDIEKALAG